jgi:hypothetical protein
MKIAAIHVSTTERAGVIPFDDCFYDHPKIRTKAMELERQRINRDQTPYNNYQR